MNDLYECIVSGGCLEKCRSVLGGGVGVCTPCVHSAEGTSQVGCLLISQQFAFEALALLSYRYGSVPWL